MITTPYLSQLQASHEYQGDTNNCGPFCAAITAKAFGFPDSTGSNFAKSIKTFRWKGFMPIFQRVPNNATMPWGATHLLKDLNLVTKWKPFSSELELMNDLQSQLVQMVIIGEWRPAWAHYLIFAAYQAAKGYGFIDPGRKSAEIHWYKPTEFMRLWRHYGKIRITAFPVR